MSSQFKCSSINHCTSHVSSWLGRKPRYMQQVAILELVSRKTLTLSNSQEKTYILLELPYSKLYNCYHHSNGKSWQRWEEGRLKLYSSRNIRVDSCNSLKRERNVAKLFALSWGSWEGTAHSALDQSQLRGRCSLPYGLTTKLAHSSHSIRAAGLN